MIFFFFSSRRRHTSWTGDWSSDVCSSDLSPGRGTSARPHHISPGPIGGISDTAAWGWGRDTITRGGGVDGRDSVLPGRAASHAPDREPVETHSISHSTRPPETSSGGRRFFRPLRFKPTHSDSLHSRAFTRRARRAVVGADCAKADRVYLKRPAPAQAPCPQANPGLHLATLQASGRVALAPRRCAVTRA